MKEYTFTEEEMIAIREALREYKYLLPNEPVSESGKKHKMLVEVLYKHFEQDVRLYKEKI